MQAYTTLLSPLCFIHPPEPQTLISVALERWPFFSRQSSSIHEQDPNPSVFPGDLKVKKGSFLFSRGLNLELFQDA